MTAHRLGRLGLVAVVALALLASANLAFAGSAAPPAASGIACRAANGVLSLFDAKNGCPDKTRRVTIGAQGEQGPPGAPGLGAVGFAVQVPPTDTTGGAVPATFLLGIVDGVQYSMQCIWFRNSETATNLLTSKLLVLPVGGRVIASIVFDYRFRSDVTGQPDSSRDFSGSATGSWIAQIPQPSINGGATRDVMVMPVLVVPSDGRTQSATIHIVQKPGSNANDPSSASSCRAEGQIVPSTTVGP